MISEKDKKTIDEFLEEQGFDFNNYDDFIEYIQARGMLNDKIGFMDKLFFTKINLKGLYEEYINPIKRVCKQYNLSYRELSDLIGFNESSIRTIASNGAVTTTLLKSLELLKENIKLKEKLNEIIKINETLKELLKR